jgi:heptosyltransferase-2
MLKESDKIERKKKALIIQTAFLGDVVLATPLVENLFQADIQTDFLLRKGNESLLLHHPKIQHLWIWDKGKHKNTNLLKMLFKIRQQRYDFVFCLQRFASGGILAALSGAKFISGFQKNPFSFAFHSSKPHELKSGLHEVDRNLSLLPPELDFGLRLPKLYPQPSDYQKVKPYQTQPYLTLSPASVWFTKQFAEHKWGEFLNALDFEGSIFVLGGKSDGALAQRIARACSKPVQVLCGELSLLQSAALMQSAKMNYVNDSAPMHLASAVNAPVCAVFCSTVPEFGFGPLSEHSTTVQTSQPLDCRPCGLHGHRKCPKGHFNCSEFIDIQQLINALH